MVQVSNLRKRFGSLTAVDGVSFGIGAGEAFGLLGPNGAGKTTTIHMMIGLLRPDQGEVRFGDGGSPDSPQARRQLGIAPQSLSLYDELTANENLRFFGRLYGLHGKQLKERVDWALSFAGLTDRRSKRVSTFSGGMKRRLNFAAALIHEPKIVLLDEPTVGVDPQSRFHLLENVERLKSEGLTVIYTTHYMEEAQRLCDRVAIMDRGRILALDRVDALIDAHGGSTVIQAKLRQPLADPAQLPGRLEEDTLRLESTDPLADVGDLMNRGLKFDTLQISRPDLETVFLALTGRSLRD